MYIFTLSRQLDLEAIWRLSATDVLPSHLAVTCRFCRACELVSRVSASTCHEIKPKWRTCELVVLYDLCKLVQHAASLYKTRQDFRGFTDVPVTDTRLKLAQCIQGGYEPKDRYCQCTGQIFKTCVKKIDV